MFLLKCFNVSNISRINIFKKMFFASMLQCFKYFKDQCSIILQCSIMLQCFKYFKDKCSNIQSSFPIGKYFQNVFVSSANVFNSLKYLPRLTPSIFNVQMWKYFKNIPRFQKVLKAAERALALATASAKVRGSASLNSRGKGPPKLSVGKILVKS